MKTYRGVAGFAIMSPNFPHERFLEQFPETMGRPFLPVLYGFFGKSWKGMDLWVKKFEDREMLLQIHLAFRTAKKSSYYHKAALSINNHMSKLGSPSNLKLIICPGLEYDFPNAKWKEIKNIVQSTLAFPHTYSCNPLYPPAKIGMYEEVHGDSPIFSKPMNRRIYNPDGVSVDFSDGEKYSPRMGVTAYKNILSSKQPFAACTWSANQQGIIQGSSSNQLKPKDRVFKITDQAIYQNRELLKGA